MTITPVTPSSPLQFIQFKSFAKLTCFHLIIIHYFSVSFFIRAAHVLIMHVPINGCRAQDATVLQ